MKAVVIPKYGDADVLEVRELPDPKPAAGEVSIAVRAAGLNFAEVSARQGLYPDAPKPPCVVGYEVAGTIEGVGDGVTDFRFGDRVWALCRFGGHAERVSTRASLVRRMPEGLGFEEAAGLPVVYATAALLVSDYGHVRAGDRVLIHMAAGGVGLAAIQLCRRIPGVTLYGTASASKHAFLREQGLHHPIDYRTADFEVEVQRLTNGRGVHVILDPMGGPNWRKNYRLLSPLGRLMIYGLANANKPGKRNLLHVVSQILQAPRWSPLALMDKNRAVMGLNLGHLFDEDDLIRSGLDSIAALLTERAIVPHVDSVFPFSRAAEAHRRIESRANVGKIILVPDATSP